MKFGVCCSYNKVSLVQKMKYDYIELNFNELVKMSDKEYNKLCSKVEKHKFPVEALNSVFPPSMKIVGDSVNIDEIKAHVTKGIKRAVPLGVKVVVIGSGGARTIPDGFDRNIAEEQFINVLRLCGDIGAEHNIEIVIEPLQSGETNLIHTVAQGIDCYHRTNHPNVKCLADFYHVFMSGESLEAIENSNGLIRHAHIARPNADRRMPSIKELDTCRSWALALKKCGYDMRLSLEGDYYPMLCIAIARARSVIKLFN